MASRLRYAPNSVAAAPRTVRLAVYADDGTGKTTGVAGVQPDVILYDGTLLTATTTPPASNYAGTLTQIGATEHYLCVLTLAGSQQAEIVLRLPASAGVTNPTRSQTFVAVGYDPTDAAGLGLSRLDATVASRMGAYTQPAGFLAATFPAAVGTSTYAGTPPTAAEVKAQALAAIAEADRLLPLDKIDTMLEVDPEGV